MATKTIDANMLAKMFLAGAQNIEAKKEFSLPESKRHSIQGGYEAEGRNNPYCCKWNRR